MVAPLWPVRALRVESAGAALLIHADTTIGGDSPYLAGHFPGFAVFPGVFVVEFVCQAVALALGERAGGYPELRTLRYARFTAAVRPGDELSLLAEVCSTVDGHRISACCRRGDKVAAELSGLMAYRGEGECSTRT